MIKFLYLILYNIKYHITNYNYYILETQDWCSKDYKVHGLWPQYNQSDYPTYCENDEDTKKIYLEKFTLHPNETIKELKILADLSIKNKIKNYEETDLGTYIMKVKRGEEIFQMFDDRAILIKWL